MRFELLDASIVIPANAFNPTIISQTWLTNHGIVSEEDLRSGFMFTEAFSQVQTGRFDLMIVPPRLQFTPKVAPEEQQALLVDKVGTIIRLLPHTPFTACGLNFIWQLVTDEGEPGVPALSRRLFCREGDPFFDAFDRGVPRYGTYLSCDALDCRLKLDVKPLTVISAAEHDRGREFEILHFGFNYHLDVTDDPEAGQKILRLLGRWDKAKNHTGELLNLLDRGNSP